MGRRASAQGVAGWVPGDEVGPLYRAMWDKEEERAVRYGVVAGCSRPTHQRDAFRRHEPVVVAGGFPAGTLPRGSGGKHFLLFPDDRIVEAVYGIDYGPVDQEGSL